MEGGRGTGRNLGIFQFVTGRHYLPPDPSLRGFILCYLHYFFSAANASYYTIQFNDDQPEALAWPYFLRQKIFGVSRECD